MPSKPMTNAMPEDAIRTRAYLLWEADGRPFGRDDHYWGLALSETIATAPVKSKRAAASAKLAPAKKVKAKAAKAKPAKRTKAKAPVAKGKKSKS